MHRVKQVVKLQNIHIAWIAVMNPTVEHLYDEYKIDNISNDSPWIASGGGKTRSGLKWTKFSWTQVAKINGQPFLSVIKNNDEMWVAVFPIQWYWGNIRGWNFSKQLYNGPFQCVMAVADYLLTIVNCLLGEILNNDTWIRPKWIWIISRKCGNLVWKPMKNRRWCNKWLAADTGECTCKQVRSNVP